MFEWILPKKPFKNKLSEKDDNTILSYCILKARRIFCKEQVPEVLSSQEKIYLDMARSFRDKIRILSRQVGYFLLFWKDSEKSR